MYETLRELCLLNGISGREDDVRNYITNKINSLENCEFYKDALGNLIVNKKGRKTPSKKIMFDAHMDEVGFIVTDITDDGFLKIAPVGGIENRILPAKRVKIGSRSGVIGVCPVHLLENDAKKKIPDISKMYVDAGFCSKEDALSEIEIGQGVYFDSEYKPFGDGFIKSKALDDRLGCAFLLEMLKDDSEYDYTCTFSVQEEIGARGARVLCAQVKPDIAVAVETTTACDLDGINHDKQVCELGKGAVVSFMDRGTIYDRELYGKIMSLANINEIPAQTKRMVAGGNNASSIHNSYIGVKTAAVSVPCRYLHSPACVVKKTDVESVLKLLKIIRDTLCND